jgi:heme-degrading monooxygenase HmoA
MVLEVGLVDVLPGSESAFLESYRAVRHSLADSPGALSVRMTQGVESPSRFVLLVEWESVDAHLRFRASEAFGVWRRGVGPHFAGPPHVEHFIDR